MCLCMVNLGEWAASLKEKWSLKRMYFGVYTVLTELNFMNATVILMKQNTDYSEKKMVFFNYL